MVATIKQKRPELLEKMKSGDTEPLNDTPPPHIAEKYNLTSILLIIKFNY